MILEPTSIGAVSRVTNEDGRVTLEVRPSRNALLILIVIGVVPACAVGIFVGVAAKQADDIFAGGTRAFEAIFALGTVFIMTAAVCAATFKPLTRLLRTAARRATFTSDAKEFRLLA